MQLTIIDIVPIYNASLFRSTYRLYVLLVSFTGLSKEQEAMETMTAAFIHKFPRVTPELFIDLSQFIPYMSVSDIMTFPASLMVNESV